MKLVERHKVKDVSLGDKTADVLIVWEAGLFVRRGIQKPPPQEKQRNENTKTGGQIGKCVGPSGASDMKQNHHPQGPTQPRAGSVAVHTVASLWNTFPCQTPSVWTPGLFLTIPAGGISASGLEKGCWTTPPPTNTRGYQGELGITVQPRFGRLVFLISKMFEFFLQKIASFYFLALKLGITAILAITTAN
jgi:hypothetical protein